MWQIYGALNAPPGGSKSPQRWGDVTRGAVWVVNNLKDERRFTLMDASPWKSAGGRSQRNPDGAGPERQRHLRPVFPLALPAPSWASGSLFQGGTILRPGEAVWATENTRICPDLLLVTLDQILEDPG